MRKLKRVEKVWGWEEWVANGPMYCGKLLHVRKGARCSMHHHERKMETFTVIHGRIALELDGDLRYLIPGMVVDVYPYTKHRFTGMSEGHAIIMEISTQHFEDDSIREEPSNG